MVAGELKEEGINRLLIVSQLFNSSRHIVLLRNSQRIVSPLHNNSQRIVSPLRRRHLGLLQRRRRIVKLLRLIRSRHIVSQLQRRRRIVKLISHPRYVRREPLLVLLPLEEGDDN